MTSPSSSLSLLIEATCPRGSWGSGSGSHRNSKSDLSSVNLMWVCTTKGQRDWVHPSLINTEKWCHSISLRLTFMSSEQVDGREKWISASHFMMSFLYLWCFQCYSLMRGSAVQRTSFVTWILMMGCQRWIIDHLVVKKNQHKKNASFSESGQSLHVMCVCCSVVLHPVTRPGFNNL